MAGLFDDLIPKKAAPAAPAKGSGLFDDLIPQDKGPTGALDELKRTGASLYGGAVEGLSHAVHGVAHLGDAYASAQNAQAAATGYMSGPNGERILVPEASRAEFKRLADSSTPTVSPYVDPVAERMKAHATAVAPANRNRLEGVAHAVGDTGTGLAAAAVNPGLGAAYFGAGGAGTSYDEAKAKGASENTAQTAAGANAITQAVASILPFHAAAETVLAPVAKKVGGSIAGRIAARVATRATGNAAMGGAMAAGENVVAGQTYDPSRSPGEGVPQAAATMALAGEVIHQLHKSPSGVRAFNSFWAKKGVDPDSVSADELHPEHLAEMVADPHVARVLAEQGLEPSATAPSGQPFHEKVTGVLAAKDAKANAGTIAQAASATRAELSAAASSLAEVAANPHVTPEEITAAQARVDAARAANDHAESGLGTLATAVGADNAPGRTPLKAKGTKEGNLAERDLGQLREKMQGATTGQPGDPGYVDPAALPVADKAKPPEVIPVTPNGQGVLNETDAARRNAVNRLPVPVDAPTPKMSDAEIAAAQRDRGNRNAAPAQDTLHAPQDRAPQTRDDLAAQRDAQGAFEHAQRQSDRIEPGVRDTQPGGLPEGPKPAPVTLDEGFPVRVVERGQKGAVKVERYDPRTGMADDGAEPYWTHEGTLQATNYTPEPRRAQDFGARDNPERMSPEKPRMAGPGRPAREDTQTFRATDNQVPPDGGPPFPEQAKGPGPFRDQPSGERAQRAANEEELRQRYERSRQEGTDNARAEQARSKRTGKSTNTPAEKDADGRFQLTDEGYVKSTGGGPIVFPDHVTAAKWVTKVGHAESPDQIFDLAAHPTVKAKDTGRSSESAVTVVERGRQAKPDGHGTSGEGEASGARESAAPEAAPHAIAGPKAGTAEERVAQGKADLAAAKTPADVDAAKARLKEAWDEVRASKPEEPPFGHADAAPTDATPQERLMRSKRKLAELAGDGELSGPAWDSAHAEFAAASHELGGDISDPRAHNANLDDAAINAVREGKRTKPAQGPTLARALLAAGGIREGGDELGSNLDHKAAGKLWSMLVRKNGGMSLERAAQWAQEHGFLGDPTHENVATAQDLIDALKDEQRGNPRYAKEADPAAAEAHARAQDWEELINHIGLDVQSMSNAEIKGARDSFFNATPGEHPADASDDYKGPGSKLYSNPLDPELIHNELLKPAGRLAKAAIETLTAKAKALLAEHYGEKGFSESAVGKFLADVHTAIRDGIGKVAAAIRPFVRKAADAVKAFGADESGAGPNPFEKRKPEGPTGKAMGDKEVKAILDLPKVRRELPKLARMKAEAADVVKMWKDIAGDPKQYGTAIRRSFDLLMSSNGQGMRIIANARKGADPATSKMLMDMADQLATDPGSGRKIGETWERAVQGRTGEMVARARSILGEIADPAKEARITDILSGRARATPGSDEERIARQVRSLLDDNWVYMTKKGLEPGYVRANYFPRVIDLAKVSTGPQRAAFLDAAAKLYRGMGFSGGKLGGNGGPDMAGAGRTEAERMADAWLDRILGVVDSVYGGNMPHTDATKGRALPPQADTILGDFLQRDLRGVLGDYFHSTARAAEATSRFGSKGEKFAELRTAMMRSPAFTDLERSMVETHFHSSTGYMYAGMKDAPRFNDLASVWGVLTFLPRATWSSLSEGAAIGARANDWTTGVTGLVDSFRELTALRQKDDAAAVSEFLGVIGDSANDLFMSARAGVDPRSAGVRKLVSRFFKANLLTQLTEAQRVAAVRIGRSMIHQLVKEVATGHARAKSAGYMLRDLGIDDAGAKALHTLLESNKGTVPLGLLTTHTPTVDMYKAAIRRFADESIQNPSMADKPAYASHPWGRAAYAIQSFNFSNTKNVLGRAMKSVGEGLDRSKGYTTEDHMRLLNPVLGITLLTALGAAVADVRDRLTNNSARAARTPMQEAVALGSRANVFGNYDAMVNMAAQGGRYQKPISSVLTGAYIGGVADDASKIAGGMPWAAGNSPNTNNAEWNRNKAAYHMFGDFAASALAASLPIEGQPVARAVAYGALQYATAPQTAADFADATVGERTVLPKTYR